MSPREPSARSSACHPGWSDHVEGETRSASRIASRCSSRATRVESSNPPGPLPRPDLDAVVDRAPLQLAIERREALLGDLPRIGPLDIEVMPWPELLGRDLLRGPAQAVRDVPAVEPELATASVDAPDHEVRVGMVGIEVIDGQPLELAIEIALDPSHEAPDVRSEIELRGVFRGQDEPKLVALPGTRLLEGLDASRPVGRVRHALGAVLLNTVALDVPQVQRRRLRAAGTQARDVHLDDRPARTRIRSRHGDARARDSPLRRAGAPRTSSTKVRRETSFFRREAPVLALGPSEA